MIRGKLLAFSCVGSAALIAGAAIAEPVADGGRKFTTSMSGAEEVGGSPPAPGVGDPDGTGTGSVTINVGQERVCWEFTVAGIIAPNRGHIHRAPAGSNGGIVVDFFNVAADEAGPLTGCTTTPQDQALLKDIIQNPSAYYLNLHNSAFPAGAIRGQLEKK